MIAVPESLESCRMLLRPFTASDASDVFVYASDPRVTRLVDWPTHRSMSESAAFIATAQDAWRSGMEHNWAIVPAGEGSLIGGISIRPQGTAIDIGYVLAQAAWGQGYATEACAVVADWARAHHAITRIWATCDVENAASARVLEKIGLRRESTLRGWAIRPNLAPGEPRDAYLYSWSRASAELLPRQGESVLLRRLTVADLRAFQEYRADPELGRYQGWSPMPDPEAREFLDEMSRVLLFRPGEWIQIGIADPEFDVLLGDLGLFLSGDGLSAEIGFTLARSAQRRGRGTAAVREAIRLVFQHTRARRIVGITDVRNTPSSALLERVGMHRVEERSVMFRDERCVESVYELTRDDWEG